MKARIAVIMLALSLLAAGCDSRADQGGGPTGDALGGPQPARATGNPCAGRSAPGSRSVSFLSAGRRRSAWIHIPPARAGQRLPLVIAFHFAGGTGRAMEAATGLSALADHEHFVALYPNAVSPHHTWTLTARDKNDDIVVTSDLLKFAAESVCLNQQQVYATGVSNGGGMAARAGCELASVIAAVAPVAGGYRSLGACKPEYPESVLEIHGTADTVVPYGGRGPEHAGSVPAYVAGWVARDGCKSGPATRDRGRGVVEIDWGSCKAGVVVRHLRLGGTTHGWPGSDSGLPRHDPTGLSASREVWRFFKGKSVVNPDP